MNEQALAAPATDSAAPRRIVIVVGSMTAGGAERVATTMARAWVERGREVWLVSTYLGSRISGYDLHPRVAMIFLADTMSPATGMPWRGAAGKIRALRKLVSTIKPDVVISLLTNVNVLVIAALATLRVPLIVSERTDPAADVEMTRTLRIARALSYRFADCLVVQTAAAALRYQKRLPGLPRIAILPNPLADELAVSPLRAQHQGSAGCVVAMGRLTPEKGYDKLIQAFGKAFVEGQPWRLQIWGEGPQREALQQLINQLQLSSRVQLCGLTSEPWSILAAAQIFALSSAYEGFPNAMLEAMAVGLPCVAFDCPSGPRELSDGGKAAILIPSGNIDLLADALRDVAANREHRQELGARAAAFVRREFSQDAVLTAWDALIREVIHRRKCKVSSLRSATAKSRRGG